MNHEKIICNWYLPVANYYLILVIFVHQCNIANYYILCKIFILIIYTQFIANVEL
jgi:hypothetical protein